MNASKVFVLLFIGTAIGCLIWFGLIRDAHIFHQQLIQEDRHAKQEDRHAEQVGAKPLPQSPIRFDIKNRRDSCVFLNKAEFDGDALFVDWEVHCHESFAALYWKEKSPDGTIVDQGYEWILSGAPAERGEHGQFKTSEYLFKLDPRAVLIELSSGQ